MVHSDAAFEAAPWPAGLWVTSFLATGLLAVTGYFAVQTIVQKASDPIAETFGAVMAATLPLIALGAALFVVRGYDLGTRELRIRRLLWSTRIPLDGLSAAAHDPAAMRRSMRLFGNGGLYSYTGLFRSRELGRYRAFVTDPKRAVVLKLPKRTVVISPASPESFLQHLALRFPEMEVGLGA